MRAVAWIGTSRQAIRRFPDAARQRAGFEVYRVQLGLEPTDWKPMPSIGSGVREIRVHTDVEHRVIYVCRFEGVVVVLHAFEKRSQRTSPPDVALIRERLKFAIRSARDGSLPIE